MRELTVRTRSLKTGTGIQCLDPLPLSIPSLFPTSLFKDPRSYLVRLPPTQYRSFPAPRNLTRKALDEPTKLTLTCQDLFYFF